METREIVRKVRQIEIKTRGLVNEVMSGEYHAVFKGRGMNFSEVREYQIGDDVRTIDWNVSARTGRPHVKLFEEERELVVMLLCDVSSSSLFGSGRALKMEVAAELAAVLAFSAINNNDKVGLLLFTDHVEKFIAPRKGRSHILRILRELITFEPQRSGTSITTGLEYLLNVLKKRAIVFLISDFIDEGYQKPLRVCARKHDLMALHLTDPREIEWPSAGLVKLHDAESGQTMWIDSSSRSGMKTLRAEYLRWQEGVRQQMQRSGADYQNLSIAEDYVRHLVTMFKRREQRR
ncbi:MAG: DUF58 domain-containing protein [Calditrichaeota bacterium]|nr:DUF58 domain-containing protein [Calditrichota bacterium]MCB9391153.1 DUF58 domain-containing protein [Calditrichota bacterium]